MTASETVVGLLKVL